MNSRQIDYTNIYNSIVECKGSLVTFIYDNDSLEFLKCVLEDFKTSFTVENYSKDVLGTLEENSILVVDFQRGVNYENFLEEIKSKNIIVIVMRKYNETTNTELFGSNDSAELFKSHIIFITKNGKLKVLKSRITDLESKKYANIDKLVRSIKLKILDKITKK